MLNPEAYRQMIQVQGERFRWLKAVPSDQYNPATGLNQDRQDVHSDHGHLYLDQGVFRGLITQQKRDMMHPEFGWVLAGSLWLTTMPDEVRFGPFDKVVLLDRTQLARERCVKGEDNLGQVYPVQVLTVADSTATYVEDVDYRLDAADRRLTWLPGGSSPADGATYACEYLYNPVYWFLGEGMRAPRPTFGTTIMTPQRGLLSLTPPEA